MYNHIRGILIKREPHRVVVETAGMGYDIAISMSSYDGLPSTNEEVLLYLHLYVREDQLRLYGFLSEAEKEFFALLISVSGVGPAVALNILSCPLGELQQAIAVENASYLQQIKGIGKKTARKICLELKDKLAKLTVTIPGPAVPTTDTFARDAVAALVSLGYSEEQGRKAVETVRKDKGDDIGDTSDLVRLSLVYLRS